MLHSFSIKSPHLTLGVFIHLIKNWSCLIDCIYHYCRLIASAGTVQQQPQSSVPALRRRHRNAAGAGRSLAALSLVCQRRPQTVRCCSRCLGSIWASPGALRLRSGTAVHTQNTTLGWWFPDPLGLGGGSCFQGKAGAGEPSPVSLPALSKVLGWVRAVALCPCSPSPTLCLTPRMVPSSCKPHGEGHVGCVGWASVPLQEQGPALVDRRERRWGTATAPAIGTATSACLTVLIPPAPSTMAVPACCPGGGWLLQQ